MDARKKFSVNRAAKSEPRAVQSGHFKKKKEERAKNTAATRQLTRESLKTELTLRILKVKIKKK